MKHILLLLLFINLVWHNSEAQALKVRKYQDADSLRFKIINTTIVPMSFELHAIDSVKQFTRANGEFIVPAKDTLMNIASISNLKVIDTTSFNFNHFFTYKGYYGDPSTIKPDLNYKYTLPFSKRKKVKINQGFNGKKSHQSVRSKYALDFGLKIGDTVVASRAGMVVRTISHFKESGDISFINKANKVVIMHTDGTFGNYVHLDFEGVLVSEGDQVSVGQPIGISGNTGYSSGPHLHFVVRREKDIAIPIQFEGYSTIKQGKKYKRKD
ncbi:M23 family metallopeptidase [Winogradskyella maritima]|uniref:M23 family metallopeptidase n=1 Tax=Winogradskyella maritima TaxID=1517766 RepID=A0ABV8AJN5_9FLAO|nr:M23 family metallopeptidase [Winogradskyella maritima]